MHKGKELDIVQSTSSGKLYISTNDFFNQPAVRETVQKLLNSDIYKSIQKNKQGKH